MSYNCVHSTTRSIRSNVQRILCIEAEGGRIVFLVVRKLRAEANEGAVEPAQDVRNGLSHRPRRRDSRHEDLIIIIIALYFSHTIK